MIHRHQKPSGRTEGHPRQYGAAERSPLAGVNASMNFDAAGGRDSSGMGDNDTSASPIEACQHTRRNPSPSTLSNHVSHGSQQLRLLRRALRDGIPIEAAADLAGMCIGEARDHAARDAKFPPPPEAFALLFDPDARAAASQQEHEDMARGPKRMARNAEDKPDAETGEGGGTNGEYSRPDAALAFKIYDEQLKPKEAHLSTIKGDMSQPYQDIKDKAHFPRKVLNFIIALEGEEDAKRDHLLLALSEGLKHRKLYLPRDLVSMANGEDGDDLVPTGERESGGLATLGDEEDDCAHLDDGFEAPVEEIAAQVGRGRGRKASVSSVASPANEGMRLVN